MKLNLKKIQHELKTEKRLFKLINDRLSLQADIKPPWKQN